MHKIDLARHFHPKTRPVNAGSQRAVEMVRNSINLNIFNLLDSIIERQFGWQNRPGLKYLIRITATRQVAKLSIIKVLFLYVKLWYKMFTLIANGSLEESC